MEENLVDYIPIIGDIYKFGKLGYKIGCWLSQDSASDATLERLANCIRRATESDTMEETYEILSEIPDLIDQYNGGKKYQNALYLYLLGRGLHLLALCQWSQNAYNQNELIQVGKIFNQASKTCSAVWEINKTWFTDNSEMIVEIRQMADNEKKNIKQSKKKWHKYCIELDKALHPWKYRIKLILFICIIAGCLAFIILRGTGYLYYVTQYIFSIF